MPVYPYTHLFLGQSLTVAICGPHIQVLDTATGELHASTASLPGAEKTAIIKSGTIICATIDDSFEHLATSAEDKQLKIWKVTTLQLLNERELPKRPTAIRFIANGQTLLVSDKFGDVFSYPFTPAPVREKSKKDALSSHENPSGGELILGHTSFLTDFCLSHDGRFIITADRDEHIRVSWYPQGYVIESFCLGHLKFVSTLHIPPSRPSHLVSGGGDPVIKIWDWMSGRLQYDIPVADSIKPFIKVVPPKRRKDQYDGDDDEQENTKRRKKKGKARAKGKEPELHTEDAVVDEMPEEIFEARGLAEPQTDINDGPPEKALVLGQLGSVQSGEEVYLVWRAIGASAIFVSPFPGINNPSPSIFSFDFGTPVLYFSIVDARIYVTLDASWPERDTFISKDNAWVRLLQFESERLVEVLDATSLIDALNSTRLLSVTLEEQLKFDLYQDLTALPKRTDFETSSLEQDALEAPLEDTAGTSKLKGKKALGRLKSKNAVAKVAAGGQFASTPPAQGDAVEPGPKRVKQHGQGEEEMETDP